MSDIFYRSDLEWATSQKLEPRLKALMAESEGVR